ncbi:FadR/GntR family transcriptional regulator [Pseudonocardia halophobica]|uniref:GntR family transcriptional regulator n=1 Tax=Pseudonocardia halophobica TaxID=29401 RepID=A0A9W6L190_9PSEU|nr:FCD domain-containing protein [Pseudonocardia halophobica]GLL10341.1 GntR family transcriptional regulator [Pseudonocardia halophobica]
MPLATTRRAGLVDQVIEQIRAAVAAGEWPVGTRLPPEAELAEALGVGRNTVREAVRALAHAGLLEVRQGDGTFVRATSEISGAIRRLAGTELREVLQVRRLLEAEGARLAARHRTAADLAELEAAMSACEEAERAADLAAFTRADLAFHQLVLRCAHNAVLAELYRGLTEVVHASVATTVAGGRCESHTGLLAAIRAGDAAAAAAEAEDILDSLLRDHTGPAA